LTPGAAFPCAYPAFLKQKIEKGCRFWHNSFCPKEILPEEATALWPQSVSRKTLDFIP
jgi:hypothetical protein